MPLPDLESYKPAEKILKQHYRAWGKLVLPTRSDLAAHSEWKPEDLEDWEYEFLVDRRNEEASLFTADDVIVTGHASCLPRELKSRKREQWIQIDITPKNPYNPQLGAYTLDGDNDKETPEKQLFVEFTGIYLSNQGRAFEITTWDYVHGLDVNGERPLTTCWLKRIPATHEVQNRFYEDPVWSDFPEQLRPLKGHTLERLDFLLMMVKRGQILLPNHL